MEVRHRRDDRTRQPLACAIPGVPPRRFAKRPVSSTMSDTWSAHPSSSSAAGASSVFIGDVEASSRLAARPSGIASPIVTAAFRPRREPPSAAHVGQAPHPSMKAQISMLVRHLRHPLLAAAAALAFGLSHGAAATPQGAARDEIDHLLQYVSTSSCTFVRNGSEYPADKARDHLMDKYRFAASRITTAEQFIESLATRSSFSGEAVSRALRQD